ncbi:unnamed protein product [Tuber melanosporum]|jgi:ubiquitin-like 1-activating enzyme E1 A|uniref:Ubiquitin-like 1-activating enzyme E1A n=1 Tax=Tuber melanosporum (strain Mel28) TaxID=656061 RepID=D5GAF7_TUBMM|nr:uncharacterized protein GSTUM_00005268001 [Tuber melanosporum]CAZ81500.1 unnamed protein product [Tuber melanosporum]
MAPSITDNNLSIPDAGSASEVTVASVAEAQTISADEVALYDRQIRLWGMEAQARMRNAHILVITIKALSNEVSKNLVLAGIGSLTVLDPGIVTGEDLGSQFFISEESVGLNRAEAAAPALQRLNPRVAVNIDTSDPRGKDAEFYGKFDIVIATELDLDCLIHVNDITRECNRPFYAAASYGMYGYIFADLIRHDFIIEREKSNMRTELKQETKTRSVIAVSEKKESGKTVEFVTKQELYSPLRSVISSKVDSTWRPRRRRMVPNVLPGVKALWKFQQAHNRLPEAKREDFTEMTRLIMEANRDMGLPNDIVKSCFIAPFVENATSEVAPVAAVLGGILAQDVINVLGKREQPLQNFLVFDGDTTATPILALHPEGEEDGAA